MPLVIFKLIQMRCYIVWALFQVVYIIFECGVCSTLDMYTAEMRYGGRILCAVYIAYSVYYFEFVQ